MLMIPPVIDSWLEMNDDWFQIPLPLLKQPTLTATIGPNISCCYRISMVLSVAGQNICLNYCIALCISISQTMLFHLAAAPPPDAVFEQLFVGRSLSFLVSRPEMVDGRLMAYDVIMETSVL